MTIKTQALLPSDFQAWFDTKGWQPRGHQLETLAAAQAGRSVLLTAPTGGGKTLAGFLPALTDLVSGAASEGHLHTLYLSPLKALAVDVARNLLTPVAEMALPVQVETRTGDTPQSRRQRQRRYPPHILMTTPEQLALLLSYADSDRYFRHLRYIVIDELHALVGHKRGDLLALDLARLCTLAPAARHIGLSATVARPEQLADYISFGHDVTLVRGEPGPKPAVSILTSDERVPWAGHYARYAYPAIYDVIRENETTLVFVNTRAQAEIIFQELWRLNEDNLPIALHHGSLAPEQRRKVEAAMAKGNLRAVVCTSTLDLGIDWGAVDLVIQIGAPKGLSRLTQRIGRANHQLDKPSRALLVPSNRFEVLECQAAAEAVAEGELDDEPWPDGALDVLAQHLVGTGCANPFQADAQFDEIRMAPPYRNLSRERFDQVLDFAATGGYALRRYDRYHRLRRNRDGSYRIANAKTARQYRMNVGTIVANAMIKIRFRRGRVLGEIEEAFIEQLVPGDTFGFAGEILRFEGLREMQAIVSRTKSDEAQVPSYYGGKFPLSTFLAKRVRDMLADQDRHRGLPDYVREWLSIQSWRSVLPRSQEMLVETFPRNRKHYLIAYPFEGRLAHQTLGMLMTRRMERAGLRPLGFVASEYALAVWGLAPVKDVASLFVEDMLGDDLEEWLNESNLMKRSFKNVAIIAGLIERRFPGQEKSGRQVTVSSDLIYDVLREYEPDHVLLQATRHDAARGLLDVRRVADLLARVRGNIRHLALDHISPLAVPLMLEIGREAIQGQAMEDLLAEAAEGLIDEASRML